MVNSARTNNFIPLPLAINPNGVLMNITMTPDGSIMTTQGAGFPVTDQTKDETALRDDNGVPCMMAETAQGLLRMVRCDETGVLLV